MSSNVPWKELAVVGATTLGVCCVIGWLTGAENLDKKKKPQRGGPAGGGAPSQDHQEFDALVGLAEAAMKKGVYSEAERAYLRVLEILERLSEDPQYQIIPPFINRRLAEVYEKMGNWDKCFKYLEKNLEHLMSKEDLTQDELHALLVLAERSVDLSMPNGTPAQQEKFLSIWLEIATKFGVNEAVVMAALLLGKLKYNGEKLMEAEAYLRRATSVYTDPSQREELWLNSSTAHFECLTRLEMHEAAKKCVREVTDYLLNCEKQPLAQMVPELLSTTGDRCIYLGYFDEAEYILKSTLSLMKKRGTPVSEIAQVDLGLASIWAATGRPELVLDKIKDMKEYLRAGVGSSTILPLYSKYLQTQTIRHEDKGTVVTVYKCKGPGRILAPDSILSVIFENPENGEAFPAVEFAVNAKDEVVTLTAPVDYSTTVGQIFSAEISIYNADKSKLLGTHHVFIPSSLISSSSSSSSIPASITTLSSADKESSSSSSVFTTLPSASSEAEPTPEMADAILESILASAAEADPESFPKGEKVYSEVKAEVEAIETTVETTTTTTTAAPVVETTTTTTITEPVVVVAAAEVEVAVEADVPSASASASVEDVQAVVEATVEAEFKAIESAVDAAADVVSSIVVSSDSAAVVDAVANSSDAPAPASESESESESEAPKSESEPISVEAESSN